MDTLSHGLWGGIAVGRKSKRDFWSAFAFGVLPDLLAFGPIFIAHFFKYGFGRPEFAEFEPPRPELIPGYVSQIYDFTHSFIIFALVFLLVWFVRRKPYLPMLSWAFHILLDLPTHTASFFPTPFLFPISSYVVSGIQWSTPGIFITNWFALFLSYGYWWHARRRSKRSIHGPRLDQ